MTLFKIPRYAIYIPGETSRVRFSPNYELPLFQRIYRGRIADPAGDPLRLVPHPKGSDYQLYWYEVEAESFEDLVSMEATRLRADFGVDERTEDTVFDTVYPLNLFDDVVKKALEDADNHGSAEFREDPADKILPLCKKLGIDHHAARRLVRIGFYDIEALAAADEAQLSKILGRIKAHKLIELAEQEIGILVNATPSEQIEAATKQKSKSSKTVE